MNTKTQSYTKALSRMINIPTISTGRDYNKKVFDQFHSCLKELFPLVFKTFKYEEFDGSILLSYKANNDLDPILLMSHHDVVSVEDNWEHEPFNAEIKDGKIYGRGTLDTKGNLWAILTSIEELLEEGYKFTRSIYVESACNEETSGAGSYAISRELKKRKVNFHFTLDEGGMIVKEPIDGVNGYCALVALGEKDYLDLKFIAKSKGGHSSTPDQNNPLIRLSKFIVHVEKHNPFKPYLEDTTIKTFYQLSSKMNGFRRFMFKNAKLFRHVLARLLVKLSPASASMVKTTMCFCKAKGSDGFNIIPEEAYVTGNFRIAHHDNKEEIINKMRKLASKYNIEVEVIDNGYDSTVCDYQNEQFKLLEQVILDNFNDVIVAPYISTGASDTKYFSDLSKNNFRFSPFKVTNEQLDTMHAKDENIDVSTLEPAVNFYKDLIKRV